MGTISWAVEEAMATEVLKVHFEIVCLWHLKNARHHLCSSWRAYSSVQVATVEWAA